MAIRWAVVGAVTALTLAVAGGGLWWSQAEPAEAEASAEDDLPVPPVPPRIAEGEDYDKCLAMVGTDPSGAAAFAESWTAGGEGALHCQALAEIALGEPDRGAALLDRVAGASKAAPAARAALLGQAGQAWLMAGAPERAYASATRAIELSPDDPDLLIDRAVAGTGLERYREATGDLTRALAVDPRRVDALVLRAGSWRQLGKLDQAWDDIERAFAQDADDPDALLERGIQRQMRGDQAGARRDWQRAAELAPDTATGDLAQQNLALLEAGPERR